MNSSAPNPFIGFPKQRPPLPPEFGTIYLQHYRSNRDGNSTASSLSQRMESWMHRKVAADVKEGKPKSTLEIGAGTLNHLTHEPCSFPYDIVEPFRELYASSSQLDRVRTVYEDLREIPLNKQYERIVSIAAFEHICDLPEVVARTGLLLSVGGQLRVAIPSEGAPLWWLGWQCTTGLEFRWKYKLDYGVMMRHEHVNTAAEIETVLRYFFLRVESSVFGITPALSLYQFFACSSPLQKRCSQFLRSC